MSGFWDILGTVGDYIRLGLSGPRLKNNSGNLDIKNAGDSAYVDIDAANVTARTALKILLGGFSASITHALTANRAYTLPDVAGEIINDATTPDVCNVRIQIGSLDFPQGDSINLQIVGLDGGEIKLYDTTTGKWVKRVWSDVTNYTASSFTTQYPFVPIDVFLYWNGSGIQLFTKEWRTPFIQKTVTNITNASPPVVTVGSGHGFAVDDVVVLQDVTGGAASLGDQMWRITATASTTVTLGYLDASAPAAPGGTSTNGTLYKINFVDTRVSLSLTTKDGRQTYDNGSGNYYRHIGTICYGPIKNRFYDTGQFPFIWNRYRQRLRVVSSIAADDLQVNWTASTTNQTPTNARPAGNRYNDRVWFLSGDGGNYIDVEVAFHVIAPTVAGLASAYNLYLALNSVSSNYATNQIDFGERMEVALQVNASAGLTSVDNYARLIYAPFKGHIIYRGLNFLQPMEYIYNSGANNWTIYKNFKSVAVFNYYYKGGIRGAYMR